MYTHYLHTKTPPRHFFRVLPFLLRFFTFLLLLFWEDKAMKESECDISSTHIFHCQTEKNNNRYTMIYSMKLWWVQQKKDKFKIQIWRNVLFCFVYL